MLLMVCAIPLYFYSSSHGGGEPQALWEVTYIIEVPGKDYVMAIFS